MPEIRINDTITLSATPRLENGGPATVENLIWSSSDESILKLKVTNSDGTASFKGVSSGEVEVFAEADADLGAGVSNIRSGYKIVVKQPMATGLDIAVLSIAPPEPEGEIEIEKKPDLGDK